MNPLTIPKLSCSTLAMGATQFVVHDALEMMLCAAGSYAASFTPITIVMSSPVAGAETITFLAPAARCALAASALVNRPVDSITTSTPRSPQGSAAGSRSASTRISWSPALITSPEAETSTSRVPSTVSYFSRYARVLSSVRSLAATISMPAAPAAPACTARQKFRPIRPNPLMPTRTVTAALSLSCLLVQSTGQAAPPARPNDTPPARPQRLGGGPPRGGRGGGGAGTERENGGPPGAGASVG